MLRGMTALRIVATHQANVARGPMSVAVLHGFPPPAIESAWRELLLRVPVPSHYTSPEYFVEPYFKHKKPFVVLVFERNAVVGVLTGVHEGKRVTCGLPTRPQIQLDPAADHTEVLRLMTQALERESGGAELVSIYSWECLSLHPLTDLGYRRRMLNGNPVLDLTRGPETLLRDCDGKRRNCIRSAMRHGVEVGPAESLQDYADFYRIYADWCAAKKTQCYPFEMEELAFRTTANNRRLFVARHAGRVIAGSVFRYIAGGLVEYSRNSSLVEYQRLKPNDLLVWRAIEWACAEGFSMLSMGGSHRFLREFGGSMVPIVRYRIDRTLLRRHDRYERFTDMARSCIGKLPPTWERKVRRWIGKEVKAGW